MNFSYHIINIYIKLDMSTWAISKNFQNILPIYKLLIESWSQIWRFKNKKNFWNSIKIGPSICNHSHEFFLSYFYIYDMYTWAILKNFQNILPIYKLLIESWSQIWRFKNKKNFWNSIKIGPSICNHSYEFFLSYFYIYDMYTWAILKNFRILL